MTIFPLELLFGTEGIILLKHELKSLFPYLSQCLKFQVQSSPSSQLPVFSWLWLPRISWIFRKKSLGSLYGHGGWALSNAEVVFWILSKKHGLYSPRCILNNVIPQYIIGKNIWSLLVSLATLMHSRARTHKERKLRKIWFWSLALLISSPGWIISYFFQPQILLLWT